jgi:hypothetical protein
MLFYWAINNVNEYDLKGNQTALKSKDIEKIQKSFEIHKRHCEKNIPKYDQENFINIKIFINSYENLNIQNLNDNLLACFDKKNESYIRISNVDNTINRTLYLSQFFVKLPAIKNYENIINSDFESLLLFFDMPNGQPFVIKQFKQIPSFTLDAMDCQLRFPDMQINIKKNFINEVLYKLLHENKSILGMVYDKNSTKLYIYTRVIFQTHGEFKALDNKEYVLIFEIFTSDQSIKTYIRPYIIPKEIKDHSFYWSANIFTFEEFAYIHNPFNVMSFTFVPEEKRIYFLNIKEAFIYTLERFKIC